MNNKNTISMIIILCIDVHESGDASILSSGKNFILLSMELRG